MEMVQETSVMCDHNIMDSKIDVFNPGRIYVSSNMCNLSYMSSDDHIVISMVSTRREVDHILFSLNFLSS